MALKGRLLCYAAAVLIGAGGFLFVAGRGARSPLSILEAQRSAPETFRDDRIYIDSVPRGATVRLLPKETGKGDEITLGRTPLVLEPAKTPTMRFAITMNVVEYAKAIDRLPGLENWTTRFKKQPSFNRTSNYGQDDFDFGDAAEELITIDTNGEITAVGPIYVLDWPRCHRAVALLIPKNVRTSVFHPLMPPRGTFRMDDREFGISLVRDHQFSAEQSAAALDVLSRCGKYVARTKPANGRGDPRLYSITVQKGQFVVEPR